MSLPIVSVIIPTLNEEKNIAEVLNRIPKSIWNSGEVILVDSSTDKTPIIASRLGARVIRTPPKGKGYAMKLGVKHAKSERIVFLDGDNSDPPEYIPAIIKPLDHYDLVICARNPYHPAGTTKMRIAHLIGNNILNFLFSHTGFRIIGDPLAGYRALTKETWSLINPISNDFLIETEINVKAVLYGLKIFEFPIPPYPRKDGVLNSKLIRSPRQFLRILRVLIRLGYLRHVGGIGGYYYYKKAINIYPTNHY